MIKKSAIVLMGIMLSSVLYGENYSEGKKFIGLEIGAAELQGGRFLLPEDASTYDQFYKGSDVTFGLRFGAQNEEWRTMLLFDYYDNTDEDQNMEMGMLTIDYFVISSEAASVTVKPYLGLNVGYMNYESSFIDQSGFMYGGQGGIVANVSDKVDIDVAYRYSLGYDTDDLDHFGVLMLGVNYLY
ncbi:MAG TPA: hypothetical protein ENK77_00885 [Epsilonproteobacteria bacterium]|nr:hypothetical protein [Campylobacterota bacterium]HHH37153.1 hypothetical protein [Campylobacterota bacterium]